MSTTPAIAADAPLPSVGMRAARKLLLQQHRVLRDRLDVLELSTERLCEEPKSRDAVRRAARDALRLLVAHTRLEDAILAPALREGGAWGHVRARDLLEHHAEQRDQLSGLIESYRSGEPLEQVTVRTLAWISDVRADMAHEERTVLGRESPEGDIVATDGEGG
jgi:hypothetical protein